MKITHVVTLELDNNLTVTLNQTEEKKAGETVISFSMSSNPSNPLFEHELSDYERNVLEAFKQTLQTPIL